MKYFTIEELSRSERARKLGIDNTPSKKEVEALTALVDNVLDPLRESWGKPIRVTSGYRSERVNKAVGGVKSSHHLKGMAADITTGNKVDNARLFQLVLDLKLPFTQMIDESNFSWIHISYDPSNLKRQMLKL